MNKPNSHTVTVLDIETMMPVIEASLAAGQEVVLPITGNSMRPFLRHRKDQVVLAAAQPTSLQWGDVPLYRRENGQYVLHRIVGREETLSGPVFTMLGDAQTYLEPGIRAEQIIAVATAFVERGRQVACHEAGYRRRTRRWHRLLPWRRALMWLNGLPGRVGRLPYRVLRKLKRWLVK